MFISKKKKNSSIKKLSIIKSILSDEMNNECFDCGSLNPGFISINNAIFLCKNCSYLHKKFPVEISKIIPNNLYKLEELELYYLYFGGNRKLSEFIYLNPKLSKYKTDVLYKMNELRYYRYNLSNIINEKLGLKKNIETYNYMKPNYYHTDNFNTLNVDNKYNKRNTLNINEKNDYQNLINDSQFLRFSTTNKITQKYKKRFIPVSDNDLQNNDRISVHNRQPAFLLDMDYNSNIYNNSNKNNSNLVWINNSNDEDEKKIGSYGKVDRANFNYKNYINNTININNSNNNNFYFNQSESDIDKKFNARNSANNSYVSFYNRNQFRIQRKNKYPVTMNSSLNLSTYKIYFKPKLPKCSINLSKIKKNLNFSNLDNYYTIQNMNNNSFSKNNTTQSKYKDDINNIRKKYSQIKSKIAQKNKVKIKLNLNDINYFSDTLPKNKIKNELPEINNIDQKKYISSNNSDHNSLEDQEKVQNLSIIEIDKDVESKNNEMKEEKTAPKKYGKKYHERKNLENNERKKMEFEEKRRKEELKKMKEEKNEKKNSKKKKMSKKERLRLIEEERLAMQQEEIKTKKKKAFEDKIIKEEDEEYEQEIETPKDLNKNLEKMEIEDIKEKNEENKEKKDNDINNNNDIKNNNKKCEIVDTFKNSIRNRYKRKKNKL